MTSFFIVPATTKPNLLQDRDPGDESDCNPDGVGQLLGEAVQQMINSALVIGPTIKRSYTATYRSGDTLRKHMFIGPDSFLEAVYDAEAQCEMDEQLINVEEMR